MGNDENALELSSPTSGLTFTLRIGLGCTLCTKSNHSWPPLKPPRRWKKSLLNSKNARNSSKKKPNDERNSKKPKSPWSKKRTTWSSSLLPSKTPSVMLKTDAISSSETKSSSKVKSRNSPVKNESSKTKSPNSKKISMILNLPSLRLKKKSKPFRKPTNRLLTIFKPKKTKSTL